MSNFIELYCPVTQIRPQNCEIFIEKLNQYQIVNYAVISVGERSARYGDIKIGDTIILQEYPDGRFQKPTLQQVQQTVQEMQCQVLQVFEFELYVRQTNGNFIGNINRSLVSQTVNPGDLIKIFLDSNNKVQRVECLSNSFQIVQQASYLEQLVEEYPETIGQKRLPMSTYWMIKKHNNNFKKISNALKNKFGAWRKSRGDGNCYYRAIGVHLMEYFIRQYTPSSALQTFIDNLTQQQNYFATTPGLTDLSRQQFLQYLNQILTVIRSSNGRNYLEQLLLDKNFDEYLVREMRSIGYQYLLQHREQPHIAEFCPQDMINENLNEIYSMGTEAQGIIFKVMASGLNVSIIHCSIFEDTISLDGFDPKDSGEYPVLYISYRTGHYDIFYTREQCLLDGYQKKTQTFQDIENNPVLFRVLKNSLYVNNQTSSKQQQDHTFQALNLMVSLANNATLNQDQRQEILGWINKVRDLYDQDFVQQIRQFVNQNYVKTALIGQCSYCNANTDTTRLNCGHYYCYHDLSNLVNSQILTGKLVCHICNNMIDFKILSHLLPNYKQCELCSNIMPQHSGNYCFACNKSNNMSNSINIIVQKPQPSVMNPPQIAAQIQQKSFSKCENCKQQVGQDCIQQSNISCQHVICFSCFFNREIAGCPLCNKAPQQQAQINCPVCLEIYTRDEMITFDCDEHFSCENCLKTYLQECVSSFANRDLITCIGCNIEINGNILQQYLTQHDWDRYNQFRIQKIYNLITCPKPTCGNKFESQDRNVQCPNCKNRFCSSCYEKFHDGDCDQNRIGKIIQQFEKEGQQVSQCPSCKYPYLKDENCNHVKCTQAKCEIEFCFVCSAPRSPILAHGNHYHRPQCSDWFEKVEDDKYIESCEECKKLGQLCEMPKNLKVKGRFDL